MKVKIGQGSSRNGENGGGIEAFMISILPCLEGEKSIFKLDEQSTQKNQEIYKNEGIYEVNM